MGFQYEPLDDEIVFEEFIRDLFNAMYQTQSFQLYKAKGAIQHGIDVFSTGGRKRGQARKTEKLTHIFKTGEEAHYLLPVFIHLHFLLHRHLYR
jgi:hypothetical protein